jgi:hypothetical protein
LPLQGELANSPEYLLLSVSSWGRKVASETGKLWRQTGNRPWGGGGRRRRKGVFS